MTDNKIKNFSYWTLLVGVFIFQITFVGSKFGFKIDFGAIENANKSFCVLFIIGLFGLIPRNTRMMIVHMKYKNPLPGSEAFSRWAKDDPRIDLNKIKSIIGTLPRAHKEQNLKWYQMYQKIKGQPEVIAAQKKYILFRDLAILHFFLFLLVGLTDLAIFSSYFFIGYFLLCFILFAKIAQNYGIEFVKLVLAVFPHTI